MLQITLTKQYTASGTKNNIAERKNVYRNVARSLENAVEIHVVENLFADEPIGHHFVL